jgi:hypothetical protein
VVASPGERAYSDEELAFMVAMDKYKRANARPFPSWGEVLGVLRSLGYERAGGEGPASDSPQSPDGSRPPEG